MPFRVVWCLLVAAVLVNSCENNGPEVNGRYGQRYPNAQNCSEFVDAMLKTEEFDYWHYVDAGVQYKRPYFVDDLAFKSKEAYETFALGGYRWANNRIPYEIGAGFGSQDLANIQSAMEHIEFYTCVRFSPKTASDSDHVIIESNPTGCWSYVGRIGGRQALNIHPGGGCTGFGIVVHELLHAVGYHHEQSRSDRDDHVEIMWDNVPAYAANNFAKTSGQLSAPYDLSSILHYGLNYFSENGENTIRILNPNNEIVPGQRRWMSEYDIQKVNIDMCNVPGFHTCEKPSCPHGSRVPTVNKYQFYECVGDDVHIGTCPDRLTYDANTQTCRNDERGRAQCAVQDHPFQCNIYHICFPIQG